MAASLEPTPTVIDTAARIRWVRRRVRRNVIVYTLGLVGLMVAFREIGEQRWWIWLLLYFPLWLWLLPMPLLALMSCRMDRRLLGVLAVGLATVFWASGWQWRAKSHAPREAGGRYLSLVTYNIGEDNETSVLPFLKEQQPDLFLIQSMGPKERLRSRYQPADGSKWHVRAMEQFELQSRYPITHAQLIRWPDYARGVAVVYKIDWAGTPVTVFSLHLPTPRWDYAVLAGKYGRYTNLPLRERISRLREAHRRRAIWIGELRERIRTTEGAVIVAGDFNLASWGYLYRQFCADLTDAFRVHGRGFGHTFPGDDPYLPTFTGPWLRLDYVFSNARWQPVAFTTETQRASQHRAISATLRYKP